MGLMGIHVSAHLPLHTLEQSEDLQVGITGSIWHVTDMRCSA